MGDVSGPLSDVLSIVAMKVEAPIFGGNGGKVELAGTVFPERVVVAAAVALELAAEIIWRVVTADAGSMDTGPGPAVATPMGVTVDAPSMDTGPEQATTPL